jgi:hypothetical protein
MTPSTLEPHLIIERPRSGWPAQNASSSTSIADRAPAFFDLPVTELCQLVAPADQEPRLTHPDEILSNARAIFEPLSSTRSQARLAVLALTEEPLRVNGQPAPRVTMLKERDVVQLGANLVLHVAIFHRPNFGAPEPQAIGRQCPVCGLPFDATSRCLRCQCGTHLHCEEGFAGALECARMLRSGCPSCHRALVLTPGFSSFPEVSDE